MTSMKAGFTDSSSKYLPGAVRKKPSALFYTLFLLLTAAASLRAQSVGGYVVAWGANGLAQTNVPAGLNGVTAIAAGSTHIVTLKTNGTMMAWGNNGSGQTNIPAGLSGVKAIAAGGYHTVALKSNGTVVAWGFNVYGQTNVPAGLNEVVAIAAGEGHTVALKSDGTVVAWGYSTSTNIPVGLSGVMAIAAGGGHTVALKSNGTVVAWGRNNSGQTNVPVGLSGVVAIAGGDHHTVALKSNGTVQAWGYNAYNQTTIPPGLSGVVAIAAGGLHTVALKSNGTVVAWGRNGEGQTAVPPGLNGVTAIAAGGDHTAALSLETPFITAQPASLTVNVASNAAFSVTATSAVPLSYQWVKDEVNIIGATNASLTLSNVQTNHAGNYSVIVTNVYGSVTSSVAMLTVNWQTQTINFGSLPGKWVNGSPFTLSATASSGLPVSYTSSNLGVATVSGNTVTIKGIGSTTITASQPGGATYMSAPDVSQSLIVWGITSQPANVIVNVTSNATFNVTATGAAPLSYQWRKAGLDVSGATNASLTLNNVQTNQAGSYTVLITNTWGSVTSSVAVLTVNRLGQTISFSSLPGKQVDEAPFTLNATASSGLPVSYTSSNPGVATVSGNTATITGVGSTTITASQAGSATFLPAGNASQMLRVATTLGSVVAWGYNFSGQTNVPAGLSEVASVTAGFSHTVALLIDGTVVAWGNNGYDQTNVPPGLSGVKAIAAGGYHTVALLSGGTLMAWGNNGNGQASVPIGLAGVSAIAAGYAHTVALKSNGTVVVWGDNFYGQTNVPAGLSGVTAIAAGGYHTVAMQSDGTVVAWGLNADGQTTVPAALNGVVAVAGGGYHTLALRSNGKVVAWGDNSFGQTNIPNAGLNGVTAIAAGGYHSVVLKTNGTAVAWGNNDDGQTNVPLNLSGVMAIAGGGYHTVALVPAMSWNPQMQTSDASFGVRTNQFGFTITGNNGLIVVVEASTNLANPIWVPLQTNTLTGGSSYFSDPLWTNHPARFYRLRSE
jgi:trimeric autotransporter adhesin